MPDQPTVTEARSRRLGLAAFALILLVATIAMPAWASAASFRTYAEITIGAADVVDEDLYVAANTFALLGQAERDVFAAARSIDISGSIEGSLNATAAATDISGSVEHSVRVAGGSVDVSGNIGGDLLVLGGTTVIGAGAEVDGDVLIYGGTLEVLGTVGGDVNGSVGSLEINGAISDNVTVDVERLEIGGDGSIGGDLTYQSPVEADIALGAEIDEGIERQTIAPWGMDASTRAKFFSPLVRTLWLLITGATIVALAPRLASALNDTLRRPLPAVIAGVAALVAIPILAVILLATVVGLPVSLLLIVGYVVALYLSQYVVGQRLGAWLLPRRWDDGSRGHLLLSMTIGVLLLSLLRYIPVPFIGTVVNLLIAVVGLGATVLLFGKLRPRYVSTGA